MQFKSLLTSALFFALSVSSVSAKKGRVSYYEDAPSSSNPGACGREYLADYYIALNTNQYEKGLCGKCIKIVYNNKYLVGKLVDSCPGCGSGGIDISPSMFTHFEKKSTGIFYADWEYVSCDNYGKKGSCSGSDCGMSSSSKATTVTSSKSSSTTTAKASSSATAANAKPTATNANANANPNATTSTSTNASATNSVAATSTSTSAANNEKAAETKNGANNNNNNNETAVVTAVDENTKKEDESTSYVIPLTGVLIVSGASGVGLLYANRKREGIQDLKQKFPDAFKNIKRSLTSGSSIRRKVTRTFTNKKSDLPTTNAEVDNVNSNNNSTTNPKEMDISETRIDVN